MDYLAQLREEASRRAAAAELSEMKKAAVMRVVDLATAHGTSYLIALEEFNRAFDLERRRGPYNGHGNGTG